jgi:hypothetical protein
VLLRKVTIGLVMGTLLLCPYLCLAQAAVALVTGPAEESCRRAHCGCCDDDCASPTESDQPGGSSDNRCGGTCLCHGAVLGVPQSSYQAYVSLATTAWVDTAETVFPPSVCRAEPSLAWSAACHFASAESGRKVRALMASLVI